MFSNWEQLSENINDNLKIFDEVIPGFEESRKGKSSKYASFRRSIIEEDDFSNLNDKN